MLSGGEAMPVHGEALANTEDHRAAGGHKRVPLGQEAPNVSALGTAQTSGKLLTGG